MYAARRFRALLALLIALGALFVLTDRGLPIVRNSLRKDRARLARLLVGGRLGAEGR